MGEEVPAENIKFAHVLLMSLPQHVIASAKVLTPANVS